MKLLRLGTAGYHPNERRQTACFMLPEEGIVLDAGTGFFRVRQHLATPTLDKADYVVLEGLTVRQANRAGIRVSLSNHVTIRSCQVLNNTRWGIFTDYSDDLLLEGVLG